jgi:hypothetical protein
VSVVSGGGLALGCDPGSTSGAVVLRSGAAVLAWWVWLRMGGPGEPLRVRGVLPSGAPVLLPVVPAVGAVARLVAAVLPSPVPPLVLEGLYVEPPRPGRFVNPQSVIPLAESAGAIDCVLGPAVARPRLSEWAPRLLGRVPLSEATTEAVRRARGLTWPGPGWAAARALTEEELGAVAEAAVMAGWPLAAHERRTA